MMCCRVIHCVMHVLYCLMAMRAALRWCMLCCFASLCVVLHGAVPCCICRGVCRRVIAMADFMLCVALCRTTLPVMLRYTACSGMLCCIPLCYRVMCYVMLRSFVSRAVMCCCVLCYIACVSCYYALYYIEVRRIVVLWDVLCCVMVCCIALRCCYTVYRRVVLRRCALRYVALCVLCRLLCHVTHRWRVRLVYALHYSVLRHVMSVRMFVCHNMPYCGVFDYGVHIDIPHASES